MQKKKKKKKKIEKTIFVFTISIVKASSETRLFRHLSNHVFLSN